jgi:Mg-chelatase subunit ChlD
MSYSEIVVVLDRSGSMDTAKSDHEGGLNSFIRDQQKLDGEVKFTLVQFDSINPFDVVYDRSDIRDVKDFELIPRGGTPLIEAVNRSIVHISDKLKTETVKPEQVVFMIITDGEENQSKREFTKTALKNLIEDKTKQEWQFLFLGANIDAFGEAGSLGIKACNAVNFNNFAPEAVAATYSIMSSKMGTSRSMYSKGMNTAQVAGSGCYSFSPEERKAMA